MRLKINAILFISAFLLFASCKRIMPNSEQGIVAEVHGFTLSEDDLRQVVPSHLHASDSAEFADRFIRKWATDILMYAKARQNISDMSEIDRLVNEYRKSLIIHQYQQLLVERNQPKAPTEIEIRDFYERHKAQMIARENMIKGFFLIVPIDAPRIAEVRDWVAIADEESIENLDRYSLQNAASYDFFMNTWTPLAAITRRTPFEIENPTQFLASNQMAEISDSTHHYFLRISSFFTVGQMEPYDFARENIINLLSAKGNIDFISEVENQLFNRAVANGTVRIRN